MSFTQLKKVCVFDLDGTLVASMGDFAKIAAALISEHYQIDISKAKELYYKTSGLPFIYQLEELFPENPLNAEIAALYEKEKLKKYFTAPLFKDVLEALGLLKSKGFKIVISSNNQQEVVDAYLEKNLALSFDLVLGYKPSFSKGKEHFDYIKKMFGIDTNAMLFVGDSLHDAQKALEYGVDFCGKLGTFEERDFKNISQNLVTIPQIKDLLNHICK